MEIFLSAAAGIMAIGVVVCTFSLIKYLFSSEEVVRPTSSLEQKLFEKLSENHYYNLKNDKEHMTNFYTGIDVGLASALELVVGWERGGTLAQQAREEALKEVLNEN